MTQITRVSPQDIKVIADVLAPAEAGAYRNPAGIQLDLASATQRTETGFRRMLLCFWGEREYITTCQQPRKFLSLLCQESELGNAAVT